MPAPSLAELVAPAHTALVTQECQRGVVGDRSMLPELAAASGAMVAHAARLATAARRAGVRVVHGVALRRADGQGANTNARLFAAVARVPGALQPGTPAAEVVPEIGVGPGDVVVPRYHGLSPMSGTELDAVLRNLGVRTVVMVGVSVNVAIPNFAFDAVNAGYQVVVPRDAVAGTPPEYVEAVLTHTLGLVATLTTTDDLLAAWA